MWRTASWHCFNACCISSSPAYVSHDVAVWVLQQVGVCRSVLECVCCISWSPAYVWHDVAVWVLHCVAVCCSVLQCVAVCCVVLQCVAASWLYFLIASVRWTWCCSVSVAASWSVLQFVTVFSSVLQCMLQFILRCMLQCVSVSVARWAVRVRLYVVCCSMLHVCCSVFTCVAASRHRSTCNARFSQMVTQVQPNGVACMLQCVKMCCSESLQVLCNHLAEPVQPFGWTCVWLIRMYTMSHSYVWHDTFVCVPWLIYTCDMTHIHISAI